MAYIETIVKYAAGVVGIPILTTAVGWVFGVKKVMEAGVEGAMLLSAKTQMLPEDNYITKYLSVLLKHNHALSYGSDYAYFTLSSYDGALKILGGNESGDLYFIELLDNKVGLSGQQYFIYSKFGLLLQNSNAFRTISQLSKRGPTVTTGQMSKFFESLIEPLKAQEARVSTLKQMLRNDI